MHVSRFHSESDVRSVIMRNLELATKTSMALYGKRDSGIEDVSPTILPRYSFERSRGSAGDHGHGGGSTSTAQRSEVPLSDFLQLENALSEKLLNGLDGMTEETLLREECSKHIIEYYLARCTLVSRPCVMEASLIRLQEIDRNNETVAGTLMAAALGTYHALFEDEY